MIRRYAILASSLFTRGGGHLAGSLSSLGRFLHPSLERLVHGLESLPCATIEVLAQQWHQETSESFDLDEPFRVVALFQRLDLKETLSIENTRKHDAPQPSQLLIWHSTKDARAKCRARTADRLNRYLQRFTLPRRSSDAANERVPLRMRLEIRQHLPYTSRRGAR